MIRLNKNSNSDTIVLTLSENSLDENLFYLIAFSNDTTGERLNLVLDKLDDYSGAKERYNIFTIDTATIFAELRAGDYKYQVFDYAEPAGASDATDLDAEFDIEFASVEIDTTNLEEIENGKMQLIGEPVTFVENNINITFIQNNG